MKSLPYLCLFLLVSFFSACDDDDGATPGDTATEFRGPRVAVGDGEAWTVVHLDEEGAPTSVGVELAPEALEGLPTGHMHASEFVLPLPTEVSIEPYDHVTLDWNEHGHGPENVYDIPHFDLHFYFMSETARDGITPFDSVEFNRPLPAEYLPPMYLETPGGVPRMGAHVIDLMSPEIAGTGTFTHTFIYGKYDAKMNFLEPMVTKAFLESREPVDQVIRQPEKWQKGGYYPGRYTIEYVDGTYVILLKDLEEF